MISQINNFDAEESELIMRLLVDGLSSKAVLSCDEKIYIERILNYTSLDDMARERLWHKDLRQICNIEENLNDLSAEAIKYVVFIFAFTTEIFKNNNLKRFAKKNANPCNLNIEMKKKTVLLSHAYAKKLICIFDYIFEQKARRVIPFRKSKRSKSLKNYEKVFYVVDMNWHKEIVSDLGGVKFPKPVEDYKLIYWQLYDCIFSDKASLPNSPPNFRRGYKLLSFAIDLATDFVPGAKPSKKLAKSSGTAKKILSTICKTINIVVDSKEEDSIAYSVKNIRVSETPSRIVFCINGFLSDRRGYMYEDWLDTLQYLDDDYSFCGLNWPSKNYKNIVSSFSSVNNIFNQPWFEADANANRAGEFLAEEIRRWSMLFGRSNTSYTLMGHSLGAKVIHSALRILYGDDVNIDEVYLFGGAVTQADKGEWTDAAKVPKRRIYNFYSKNDQVLSKLYRAIKRGDEPIGLSPLAIVRHKGMEACDIQNVDASEIIESHNDYKKKLRELLSLEAYDFGLKIM